MPSPTPELLQRLQHLPMAEQMAWLDRWSRALMEGQEPPPVPRVVPCPQRLNRIAGF